MHYRVQTIILLIIQVASLVAIAIATIPSAFHFHALDLLIYHDASLSILRGQWPYQEGPMVYPPLSVASFILPHLLAIPAGFSLDLETYARFWPAVNLLLNTAIALMLVRTAALGPSPRSGWAVLYRYTIFIVVSGPILLWYYDLFPATLSLGALLAVLVNRPAIAGLYAGAGIAAKLYPAVLLPGIGLFYWANGQKKNALVLLLAASVAAVIPFLPFAVFQPQTVVSFLEYHDRRGLEIESLYAGLIALLHHLGLIDAWPVLQYGTWDLASPLSSVSLQIQPFLFMSAYAGSLGICWRAFRRDRADFGSVRPHTLTTHLLVSLLVFIITNKVFSPQYILWLLPFGAFLKQRHAYLLFLIVVLTVMDFPFMFDRLTTMALAPVLVVNLRNLLTALLTLRLLRECLRSR